MARTALINAELKVGVSQLTKQWKELNSAYENFARKKIEFAQEIARIWSQAQELDKESDSEANQNHFRQQLREIIQSDNDSIRTKWVSIGSHAKELLPYANSLPPQRDSLYELSKAVKNKQPIHRWIRSGKITADSTVRQVSALSKSNAEKKRKPKQSVAASEREVVVTVRFRTNYKRSAQLLSRLIAEQDVVSVSSERAFKSALREEVGEDAFTSIADKVK
jgi:hypothetical protein